VVDAWITEYNEDRPHQSLARRVPGELFRTAAPPPGPELLVGFSSRQFNRGSMSSERDVTMVGTSLSH
jgi:hypothetical protein